MGKLFAISVALVAAVALVVYRQTVSDEEVEPEAMVDHVWWGPAAAAPADGRLQDLAADVRPFQINVSAQVYTVFTNSYRAGPRA